MTNSQPAHSGNRLIATLPPRDRARLLTECEVVELSVSDVLFEPGATMRHAYFPFTGFVSLMATIDQTMHLEVAQVGNEGMIGAQLALDITNTSLRSLVRAAVRHCGWGPLLFGGNSDAAPRLRTCWIAMWG